MLIILIMNVRDGVAEGSQRKNLGAHVLSVHQKAEKGWGVRPGCTY